LKTFAHLWQYLTQLFLEWEILEIKDTNKTKTHIPCSATFSENRAVYETKSKNMVEPGRPQIAIWRRVACWIGKATRAQVYTRAQAPTLTHARARAHTHTEKQIILIAFPWQQWLYKNVSMLRYTYKVVQIWPGLFVCKQVTVCPGHIWTTLYIACLVSPSCEKTHVTLKLFLPCVSHYQWKWTHRTVFWRTCSKVHSSYSLLL
jgi:hypothetical protein